MKERVVISRATIDRLPLYYRTLRIAQDEGREILSSDELGRRLGITPEQVRKDFASFGEFGRKGVGYYVRHLQRNIGEILGLHRNWNMCIVGMGHLGTALASYRSFADQGFRLQALFDSDAARIGQAVAGMSVEPVAQLTDIVKGRNIHIGVITVPASAAQDTADRLVDAGILGIWNFAPVRLDVPAGIPVVSEDLSVGLGSLSFYLARRSP